MNPQVGPRTKDLGSFEIQNTSANDSNGSNATSAPGMWSDANKSPKKVHEAFEMPSPAEKCWCFIIFQGTFLGLAFQFPGEVINPFSEVPLGELMTTWARFQKACQLEP